jgi:hypothetical protein
MSKYGFVINATISLHIDVEASSFEEAVELAQSAPVMSLCHQCARGDDGEWNTSGELDGDPASSELVAVYVNNEEVNLEEVKKLW